VLRLLQRISNPVLSHTFGSIAPQTQIRAEMFWPIRADQCPETSSRNIEPTPRGAGSNGWLMDRTAAVRVGDIGAAGHPVRHFSFSSVFNLFGLHTDLSKIEISLRIGIGRINPHRIAKLLGRFFIIPQLK